jgi:photosystem II stability/assembly factor-like uncharacterized protein
MTAFRGLMRQGHLSRQLGDRFRFKYGTTGTAYLDLEPDSPAFWPAPRPPGVKRAGDVSAHDSAMQVRKAGGAGAARYGVGIQRAAPRTQALLKKRGAKMVGLNLKLMLSLRGREPTTTIQIAVHPHRSDTVLVATGMGLYRSDDGGGRWQHTFAGRNVGERWCKAVAFHPKRPDLVYLGTAQGLLISRDGGRRFVRVSGTQLSSVRTKWIAFAPSRPDTIYAGTTNGAFRSNDAGKTWKWVFFETLPGANRVGGIAIDPRDPDRVVLATADGLFQTVDAGRHWRRTGALLFTGRHVRRVIANPHRNGHLVCNTSTNVWESYDHGDSWRSIYINDSNWSVRALQFDHKDRNVLWVVTSAELLRLSTRKPAAPSHEQLARLRVQRAAEPTLSEAMEASIKLYGLSRGERAGLRERTTLTGWIPTFHLVAGVLNFDADVQLGSLYLQDAKPAGSGSKSSGLGDSERIGKHWVEGQNITFSSVGTDNMPYMAAFFSWDLPSTLFHRERPHFGRVFLTSHRLFNRMRYEIVRLYEERQRLQVAALTLAPDDLRAQLALRLRLHELTAHLDALTGGLYSDALKRFEDEPWPDAVGQNTAQVTR